MKSGSSYSLKANHRCGNCNFCSRHEITLYPEDMTRLRNGAKKILAVDPVGPIEAQNFIDILISIEDLKNEKCLCKRENIWTHFLDPSCSLWQPRKIKQTKPATTL